MNRAQFLIGSAAGAFASHRGLSWQADPESGAAPVQELRVRLGTSSAQTLDETTFLYEGRRYRGSFTRTQDGFVVNLVPLEQYLYSVVPREMPQSWPAAALRAQAIIARTYVLRESNPQREYDLVPSEANQVYTGVDAEHVETTAAVDDTAGLCVRDGGGFAAVYYSSCCGGHTESSSDAWGGPVIPYLRGAPCPYCTGSPWYAWTHFIELDLLQEEFAQPLDAIGTLSAVSLQDRDRSGRSNRWQFTGSAQSVVLPAQQVRRLLGTRMMPSLLVKNASLSGTVTQAQPGLLIEGAGLGHGVGLCQWGARGMALTGSSEQEILTFYYPGTGTGND